MSQLEEQDLECVRCGDIATNYCLTCHQHFCDDCVSEPNECLACAQGLDSVY